MRKIALLLACAGALSLGACAGVPATSGGTATPAPVVVPGDLTVQQIQNTAAKVCGFVPTVSTITGIIASFFPGGAPVNTLVTGVANAICTAVVPNKTLRRAGVAGPPTVGGVRVEGYFIR
jgi:hypothetical protein